MGLRNWSYSTTALDRHLCDSEVSCIVHTELRQEALCKPPLVVVWMLYTIPLPPPYSKLKQTYMPPFPISKVTIPRLYGYRVWGRQYNPIPTSKNEGSPQANSFRYVHGDTAPRNFCEKDGRVFVKDFETCRRCNDPSKMSQEIFKIQQSMYYISCLFELYRPNRPIIFERNPPFSCGSDSSVGSAIRGRGFSFFTSTIAGLGCFLLTGVVAFCSNLTAFN